MSGQARAAGGRGVAILLAGAFVAGFWSGGSLWQGVDEVLPVTTPEASRPEQATVMAPDPEPAPVVVAKLPLQVAAGPVELAPPIDHRRRVAAIEAAAAHAARADVANAAPERVDLGRAPVTRRVVNPLADAG